jgi:hypothetical protein
MGQYLMATRWYLSHFFSSLLLAHLVLLSSLTVAQSIIEPEQAATDPQESSPLASVVEDVLGEEPLTTEQIEESLGKEPDEEGGWVDKSHEYIGTRADDLAIYLDRFFGSPIDDLESATATSVLPPASSGMMMRAQT